MKARSLKPGARSQKEENSLQHEEHAMAFFRLLAPGF
jgi:hypothetical protein